MDVRDACPHDVAVCESGGVVLRDGGGVGGGRGWRCGGDWLLGGWRFGGRRGGWWSCIGWVVVVVRRNDYPVGALTADLCAASFAIHAFGSVRAEIAVVAVASRQSCTLKYG